MYAFIQAEERRFRFKLKIREARFGILTPGAPRNFEFFATNFNRACLCYSFHPIQESRGPHLYAPLHQPKRATHNFMSSNKKKKWGVDVKKVIEDKNEEEEKIWNCLNGVFDN